LLIIKPRPVTLGAIALPTELASQPIASVPVLVITAIRHVIIVMSVM